MNFAQTVVSKTIKNIPESLRRKYIESTYRLRLAQQDETALTCDDLQSTVGWILDQKDADVQAAFQGQYDE
jgi:hypothetical protein